jgi:hypothetical protein
MGIKLLIYGERLVEGSLTALLQTLGLLEIVSLGCDVGEGAGLTELMAAVSDREELGVSGLADGAELEHIWIGIFSEQISI